MSPTHANAARTVLLRHTLPDGSWHYDWLAQRDASRPDEPVITFRLNERPDADSPTELVAERLPDHRALYLHHDGEVSGGRGRVERVAEGACLVTDERPGAVTIEASWRDGAARVWTCVATDAGRWRLTPRDA